MDMERLLRAIWAGMRAFIASVWQSLAQLWHEITGFFFLVFAVVGGFAVAREWRAWAAGKIGPGRLWLAVIFTVVFLWFGVTSFWRARPANHGGTEPRRGS